jgi:hypothetical protein
MFEVCYYAGTKRVTDPKEADRAYVWARGVCFTFPATPEGRANLQKVMKFGRVQFGAGYVAAQSDLRKVIGFPVDK